MRQYEIYKIILFAKIAFCTEVVGIQHQFIFNGNDGNFVAKTFEFI